MDLLVQVLQEEDVGAQLAYQVRTVQTNVGAGAEPADGWGTLQTVAGRLLGDLRDQQELQPRWYRSTQLCQNLNPLRRSSLLKKQRKERRIKDKLLRRKRKRTEKERRRS